MERSLARLEELGYLDDARYAATFVEGAAERGWGPNRARLELARRGVPPAIIEAALVEASSDPEVAQIAIDRAVAKLLRARGVPKSRKDRDRLRSALARRGFSLGTVRLILEALGVRSEDGEETGDTEA